MRRSCNMTTNRFLLSCVLVVTGAVAVTAASDANGWSAAQLDELRSLSLDALEPPAPDPTNRVSDDQRAATLGERLFFDTRLSASGSGACRTWPQPRRGFS